MPISFGVLSVVTSIMLLRACLAHKRLGDIKT